MNIETVREEIMQEYADKNIHEQVLMQLAELKYWVLAEEASKKRCEEIEVPYVPSRRREENRYQYNEYKREIEENGDKNLLVMVKSHVAKGVKPFARREVHMSYGTYFLIHRTDKAEILVREDEAEVI